MKRRITIMAAVSAAALAIAGAAQAHVTLHPNSIPAGSFSVLNVRVPNERPSAGTVKVAVQFPEGFLFLSTQPIPGWSAKVIYAKLAKPVTVFGEKVTQQVSQVVWTARGGRIGPGQFMQFPVSVGMPSGAKKGTVLTFKALQTYSNGEVVRWIGDPSADEPAPQVLVAGKDDPVGDYAEISAAKKRHTSSFNPLLGIVVGLPLIGIGGAALVRRRRAS